MAVVATVFVVVLPFMFGGIAHKKLAVGWKYFWFGALVMLVAQPLTRVPLIEVLQNTVLAPLLRTSIPFIWIWVAVQAVTAGLFEEGGRYVGYRLFMRREPKTWAKAVMYGLGHEGLESVLLGVDSRSYSRFSVLPSSLLSISTACQRLRDRPPSNRLRLSMRDPPGLLCW